MNDIAHNDLCIIYLVHFCTILHLPFITEKNPSLCARTCVLRDCSHERFDSGSHYRQEQFSQHKIEKRAALRNKIPPPPQSLTGPLSAQKMH